MTLQYCQRAKLGTAIAICFVMCAGLTCTSLYAQQTTDEDQTTETADNQEPTKTKEKTKRLQTRVSRTLQPVDGFEGVEMFKAMDAGQIDVRIIPKDATLCTVMVENKSDKPLSILMPEAFAAVPVLAQAGGIGGGGQGGFGGGQGGGGQGRTR